jgi:hypothetical protein
MQKVTNDKLAKLLRNYETGFLDENQFKELTGLTVEQAFDILDK